MFSMTTLSEALCSSITLGLSLGSALGRGGSGCGSARPPGRGRQRDESHPQRLLISSAPRRPRAAGRWLPRNQKRGEEGKGKEGKRWSPSLPD
uniref:Uncharacterized protein n=1 Tax=Arundo donax TaxID=35708 RepID=A0A0A9F531_ARUDO